MEKVKKFFLNDRNIMWVIIINALVIVAQGFSRLEFLDHVEVFFTLLFLIEISFKMSDQKKDFFKSHWNKFDFVILLLVIPTTALVGIGIFDLGRFIIIGLRSIRIIKAFRLFKFFPDFNRIAKSFQLGLRVSIVIIATVFITAFITSIFSTFLFQDIAPQYFRNPFAAFITTIRIFLIEGWYEIPDAIVLKQSEAWGYMTYIYFLLQILVGGLLGIPLIFGIISDAMASDNNDELKSKLAETEERILQMQKQHSEEQKALSDKLDELLKRTKGNSQKILDRNPIQNFSLGKKATVNNDSSPRPNMV